MEIREMVPKRGPRVAEKENVMAEYRMA